MIGFRALPLHELASAQEQSAGGGLHDALGGELRFRGGAVAGRVREAWAQSPAGRCGNSPRPAAVPGDQLLAALSRAGRRLARLAAAGHRVPRRHRLDSEPADLADYAVHGFERLAAAGTLPTGKRRGGARRVADSRTALASGATGPGPGGGADFRPGAAGGIYPEIRHIKPSTASPSSKLVMLQVKIFFAFSNSLTDS